MTPAERDALGIWVPQRISSMSLEDLLAKVESLRASRLAAAEAIEKVAQANGTKPKRTPKAKAVDLSKLSPEEAAQVMADSMGISVDKLLERLRRARP